MPPSLSRSGRCCVGLSVRSLVSLGIFGMAKPPTGPPPNEYPNAEEEKSPRLLMNFWAGSWGVAMIVSCRTMSACLATARSWSDIAEGRRAQTANIFPFLSLNGE